nr:MAG: hypothetical protein KatS3mg096_824 [Candidatus Parcubacteria bacterium]
MEQTPTKQPSLTLSKIQIPKTPLSSDWRPSDTSPNPDIPLNFWQFLTGHPAVFTNAGDFFEKGKLKLPESENFYWTYNEEGDVIKITEPILGQPPEKLIHSSWLGVQDNLRIYVLADLTELKRKAKERGITITTLSSGIGVCIERQVPSFKKAKDEQGQVILQEDGENPQIQYVFFLDSKKFSSQADALLLVDEIKKLHSETAKNLLSHLLVSSEITQRNAQTWIKVLSDNSFLNSIISQITEDRQMQTFIQETLQETTKAIQAIYSQLKDFNTKIKQRLGSDGVTPLSQKLIKKTIEQMRALKPKTYFLPITKAEAKALITVKVLERIRKRAQVIISSIELTDEQKEEKLKQMLEKTITRLTAYPLTITTQETTAVAVSLADKLTSDPKQWLMEAVAERGREMLLDNLAPSVGMFEYLKWNNEEIREKMSNWRSQNPQEALTLEKYMEITGISLVRAWLEKCGFEKEMEQLQLAYLQARLESLTPDQQKIYEQTERAIEAKIKQLIEAIIKEKKGSTTHPVIDIFGEIENIIKQVENEEVKQKLFKVWRAKKAIAQKQKELTDLFITLTSHLTGKGYGGWNKIRGEMRSLLESSPYFISLFGELNCAGRMVLVSSMLETAKVFKREDLVTMTTYAHSFLGGFDVLGVGRVIEPSGDLFSSYFGIPRRPVFEGKVGNTDEIIFQFPLDIGLLTSVGNNYLTYLPNITALRLEHFLLEQSGFFQDAFWYRLSVSFWGKNQESLDWILAMTRAASITDRFPYPFYYLLESSIFNQAEQTIQQAIKSSDPQTQALLPYLNFNLLLMKRTLENNEKANRLKDRIKLPEDKGGLKIEISDDEFSQFSVRVDELLKLLSGILLPYELTEKQFNNLTEDQLREIIWNPNRFPIPRLTEKVEVYWEMPRKVKIKVENGKVS